jgi:hypothetical protein
MYTWILVISEIPVMMILGAFVGYEVGKRYGASPNYLFPLLGAFFGLIFSMAMLIPILRSATSRGSS